MFLPRLLKERRRVIVSCRNSGFGDNLLATANAWYYAKNMDRTLVVYWFHSRYHADKGENAFSHFFNVPESIDGVPVIADYRLDRLSDFLILHPLYLLPWPDPLLLLCKITSNLGIISDNQFKQRIWKKQEETDRIINDLVDVRQKIIVTHGCYVPNENLKPFFDSLFLKEEYRVRADAFSDMYFRGKRVIGVHIRYYNRGLPLSDHTDYWLDEIKALSGCVDKIQKAASGLAESESEYVIFLCTDSGLVQDFISRSLSNVVTFDKEFGTDISKELHQELPEETAAATVIEMFLLAKSDVLMRFPPGSWFSHYASLYAKKIIT